MKIIKYALLISCLFLLFSYSDNEELLVFEGNWQFESTSGGFGEGGNGFQGNFSLTIEGDKVFGYSEGTKFLRADICSVQGEYYDRNYSGR